MPSRDVAVLCSRLKAALPEIVAQVQQKLSAVVRPVCTERTALEQQFEYAKGRTLPGKRVTNADGVENLSPHQRQVAHGEDAVHAVDLGVFYDRKYSDDPADYDPIGPAAEAFGLEWGGRWHSPVDRPHVQCQKKLR